MSKGMSLVEVVVSIFLLLVGILLVISLFHSALRRQQLSHKKALATLMARSMMAEIRGWARTPGNFDSNWTDYDGRTFTRSEFPGLEATVGVEELGRTLYTPCSDMETPYLNLAARMNRSVIPVGVEVGWGQPGPQNRVRLVSYIGDPLRQLPVTPVTVTRSGGDADPVPQNGTVEHTAQLSDTAGNPISDVTFGWNVEPDIPPGAARLLPDTVERDQHRMNLSHSYIFQPRLPVPETGFVPGRVRVRAAARYHGRKVDNASAPVLLQ